MNRLRYIWMQVLLMLSALSALGQCTDYDIIVGGGSAQGQIHWELMDAFGNVVASGDAPENTGECLPDGCYTMVMYDDGNNGWQGGTFSINYENTSIVVASGTLASGGYGTQLIDLNGNCGATGCQDHQISVTSGSSHNDVYWELVDEFGALIASGGAPEDQVVCLPDGCYTLFMYDANGDGWEGAVYTITDVATGTVVSTGTLASGGYGTGQVIIGAGCGSCTFVNLEVSAGSAPGDVSWDLYDALGNFIASGGAPTLQTLCLQPGCYTMYAYDAIGDGWNGAQYTFTDPGTGSVLATGTLLNAGFGSFSISVGGGCGSGTCEPYTLTVTGGTAPAEVSWSFSSMGVTYASGWAASSVQLCLDTGCYVMQLFDSGGNGWGGATWTLTNAGGGTVDSGTLASGANDVVAVSVGSTVPCEVPTVVVASDCPQAVNVCTDLNFTIDPNGWGAIWEVPALGSVSNPQFMWGDGTLSPWGTDHYGCLMGQEINTTWMIVNIASGGSLEFTLGANGAQAGFYDWVMYPYTPGTCGQVLANTLAPVRCNWNYSSTGGTGCASVVPPGGFPENYEPPLNVTAGQRYIICFSNWSSVTTVVPLVFGGTATVSCDPLVLPVELLAFNAVPATWSVDLFWATATEANTSHFRVERSLDMIEWSVLGDVPAAGNTSSERHYRFEDRSPLEAYVYYRFAMVDLDGSEKLSPVLRTEWEAPMLHCWPNPDPGSFLVDLGSEVGAAALSVIDQYGRPVAFDFWREGDDEVRILLRGCPAGVYTVRATLNERSRTGRAVVQEP